MVRASAPIGCIAKLAGRGRKAGASRGGIPGIGGRFQAATDIAFRTRFERPATFNADTKNFMRWLKSNNCGRGEFISRVNLTSGGNRIETHRQRGNVPTVWCRLRTAQNP